MRKVPWSNETKIELFGINLTYRVWKKRNAEDDPQKTISTVKNVGGKIILWDVVVLRIQDNFSALRGQ